MKKLLLLLVLLPVVGFCQPVDSLVHNTKSYVDDYAGIYNAKEKQALGAIIKSFFDTVQIALVTVETLNGMDKQEYATRLFNKWGVGSKSNNGLLILIAPNEHKAFAATGRAIQGDLTDLQAASLQRDLMAPEFKNKNYYAGTEKLLKAYIQLLSPSAKEYKKQQDIAVKKQQDAMEDKIANDFLVLFLLAIIVGVITWQVMSYKARKKKRDQEEAEVDKEYQDTVADLRSFYNEIDKSIPEGRKLKFELGMILSTNTSNIDFAGKNQFIDKYQIPTKIDGFNDYMQAKNILIAGKGRLEKLNTRYFIFLKGVIAHFSQDFGLEFYPKSSIDASKLIEGRDLLLGCVNNINKAIPENDYASISKAVGRITETMASLQKTIDEYQKIISDDAAKVAKAKYGMHDIVVRFKVMSDYCDRPEVSQGAKDKTHAAIELVNQLLIGYYDLTITAQYALYIAVIAKIDKTCSSAKDEYEEIQNMAKRKIIPGPAKRAGSSGVTEDLILGGLVAVEIDNDTNSYKRDVDDDDTDTNSNDTNADSDFGGGNTDGGGGGSEW